jgi:hypothetical protein
MDMAVHPVIRNEPAGCWHQVGSETPVEWQQLEHAAAARDTLGLARARVF